MDSAHVSRSEKSDEWLVEALRGEDPQETHLAMKALKARYEDQVRRYAYHRIAGHSWVDLDDVVQETFAGFYKYVMGHEVEMGVFALLKTVAFRRCAEAIKKQEKERKFEENIPLPEESGEQVFLEKKEIDQFVRQLPFTAPLSECPRVVFALRGLYQYPPRVVARLIGKRRGTVDTHYSNAKTEVRKYLQSKDYELDLASRKWPWTAYRLSPHAPRLVVERFANCVTPQLTPDELEPLGLTVKEFQDNYVASLMLPWEPIESEELRYPSLVLTRRPEWHSMQEMFAQLKRDRHAPDQISPEECLLKLDVDVDNEHIILTVEQILEFFPEPEEWADKEDLSEKTYLSVHLPKLTVPVSLGFFDRSLFTPELHERWPFLTEEAGL